MKMVIFLVSLRGRIDKNPWFGLVRTKGTKGEFPISLVEKPSKSYFSAG